MKEFFGDRRHLDRDAVFDELSDGSKTFSPICLTHAGRLHKVQNACIFPAFCDGLWFDGPCPDHPTDTPTARLNELESQRSRQSCRTSQSSRSSRVGKDRRVGNYRTSRTTKKKRSSQNCAAKQTTNL